MGYKNGLSASSGTVSVDEKPQPDFIVRELDFRQGWVIDAINSSGSTEQLLGVFTSAAHAWAWIAANSDRLKDRNA
ncbi:MAG: hypothetical protein ACREEK_09160 [Bradyrhizobium sp.]